MRAGPMSDESQEIRLIERARAGDEAALERLLLDQYNRLSFA